MSGGGYLILQQLPAGFRFHPTDHELVTHYLCRRCAGLPISVPIVAEVDLYKYDPWQLPGMALYGEKEWYFFSPRDRKYPNGSRPNRAAGSGYWKATGADKPVGTPKAVGIKKALVFYVGKAPRGEKTNWIMHEYRLADVDRSARKNNSLRLDDWVLCRIYNKKGNSRSERPANVDKKPTVPTSARTGPGSPEDRKPVLFGPNDASPRMNPAVYAPPELVTFAPSDSMPRLHAESSCSEHVLSPEFACEREVQSEPRWRPEWDRAFETDPAGNEAAADGGAQFDPFSTGFRDPLQDILMYWGKPF